MKKIWNYISLSAAVLAVSASLTACSDDDDLGPKQDDYSINYAYFYQPDETYAHVEYKANGAFLTDINDPLQLVPVRLTKPAPSDLQLTIAIDQNAVEEYNKANNADYKFLEGCSVVNPTMHIAKGEYISEDPITISFGDHSGFQTGDPDLILPVVISSVSDNGVTISKSSRVFLTFTSEYRANIVTPCSYAHVIDTDVENWETAFKTISIANFITTTWAADEAITVNLSIDNSLISAYNAANGTEYKAIEASLEASQLTLQPGDSTATLNVTLGDYAEGISASDEFLIPVKVACSGNGAQLAENSDVIYITVTNFIPTYTISRNYTGKGSLKVYDPEKWYLDYYVPEYDESEDMSIIFEDIDDFYAFVYENDVLTTDFGAVTKVSGFTLDFFAWYYSTTELKSIQTSTDGVNWTEWENVGDPIDIEDISVDVTFSKAIDARYVKVVIGAPSYSNFYGTVITNLHFYD